MRTPGRHHYDHRLGLGGLALGVVILAAGFLAGLPQAGWIAMAVILTTMLVAATGGRRSRE